MQVMCVVGLVNPSEPLNVGPERLKYESDYVKHLYGEGSVRQIWSRVGTNGVVMLLEAPSKDEAVRLLSELPFVKAGLLRIEEAYVLAPFRGFAAVS